MKKKDFNEIISKRSDELQKDLKLRRDRLRAIKFDLSSGKVKNVREIREIKRSIAQILTIINSRKDEKRA